MNKIEEIVNKDIFISYKNDNASNNFANRIKDDLELLGYSVYFNSDETGSHHFPDRLANAIKGCKDFLLIVSEGCLEQLKRNQQVDWIREEILIAYKANKHIIPLLMDGVEMPSDIKEMPEKLQFLPYVDAIHMPEQYRNSPFERLLREIVSSPEKDDLYRDVANCNPEYDVFEDFKKHKEEAENGNIEAMYELANMYYYGYSDEKGGTERDISKAYYWLKKLTESENSYRAYALSMIGFMYYQGSVPHEQQSYEKAYEYHLEAAKKVGSSMSHLSFMKSVGSGCDFNFSEAVEMYSSVATQGDNDAKRGLAILYQNYGKYKKAAELYNQIYSKDSEAAYELGMMYKNGVLYDPPQPDYYRAAFYFQHGIQSQKCESKVYYELGRLYFNPTSGFPKDFEQAQKNFVVAADNGHVEAQYILGYMYENGHVEKDSIKAIHYYTLAADSGHISSAAHLATLYQQPECQNYHKAFRYAQMAAKAGSGSGAFLYANLLFFGRGCKPDMNEAYINYKYAYEHGYYQAQFMIEKMKNIIDRER